RCAAGRVARRGRPARRPKGGGPRRAGRGGGPRRPPAGVAGVAAAGNGPHARVAAVQCDAARGSPLERAGGLAGAWCPAARDVAGLAAVDLEAQRLTTPVQPLLTSVAAALSAAQRT